MRGPEVGRVDWVSTVGEVDDVVDALAHGVWPSQPLVDHMSASDAHEVAGCEDACAGLAPGVASAAGAAGHGAMPAYGEAC